MSLASVHPAVVLAAIHGRQHGARILGPVVLLIIVAVVVVLVVQRRRDRRPLDDATPPLRDPAEAPLASSGIQRVVTSSDDILRGIEVREPIAESTQAVTSRDKQMPPGRYGLFGLLRSEWTKLRSVRSTMWTLGITVLLGIGVSVLATAETRAHWLSTPPGSHQGFDPISTSLIGVFIGQFAIGILGVLAMSAEYGSGTIRATFSAAPRRPLVLLAKVIVFGAVALVVAEVVSFLAFFIGQALLTAPVPHATLATPDAWRAVVGSGLYVAVLGLFALGLATIIRHTAGAISAFVGILLVVPIIVQALPTSIALDVRRYLPDRIGVQLLSGPSNGFHDAFSPWIGLLVLCGYAAALLIIGSILLVRRDA